MMVVNHTRSKNHKFNVIPSKTETVKDMNCPVYLTEDARHKYSEFIRKVEGTWVEKQNETVGLYYK